MPEYQFTPEMKRALKALVKARLTTHSLTMAKFVEYAGLTPSTWARLINGKPSGVTERVIKMLADALGTTAVSLMDTLAAMTARSESGHDRVPSKFTKEAKTWIPSSEQGLSQRLLDPLLPLPSFVEAVRSTESTSLSAAQKDMGVLGDPAYNHFVQASLVVTCRDRSKQQILFYRRKDDFHYRTLGGSILFSKSLVWGHKDIPSPLDRWMPIAVRSPAQGEQVLLRGDLAEGIPEPVAIALLAGRVRVPSSCALESIVPLCVATNNQVGRVNRDGKEMRTVYTSYVFHVHVKTALPIDAVEFGDVLNDRTFHWMRVSDKDADLRSTLRNPDDGRVNVLDYLVARRLAGFDGVLQCDEPNGSGCLRPGFSVV